MSLEEIALIKVALKKTITQVYQMILNVLKRDINLLSMKVYFGGIILKNYLILVTFLGIVGKQNNSMRFIPL